MKTQFIKFIAALALFFVTATANAGTEWVKCESYNNKYLRDAGLAAASTIDKWEKANPTKRIMATALQIDRTFTIIGIVITYENKPVVMTTFVKTDTRDDTEAVTKLNNWKQTNSDKEVISESLSSVGVGDNFTIRGFYVTYRAKQ